MQYRNLGTTELKLPVLGLGTVKFGRAEKVKYPHSFKIPSDNEIKDILSLVYEHGINFLDTAPAYGNSEQRIGELLTNRHNWILGTKVGEEFINGESNYCFTKEHAEFSIFRSLKNLKTDYLDIVLVHSNGEDEKIINGGILDYLKTLKDKGIIRVFGMSTKTISGAKLALSNSDTVMINYNLSNQSELEVINHAEYVNKGILIKKGFDSGHLVNTKDKEEVIKKSFELIFEKETVTSLILGSINPTHLLQNINILKNIRTFDYIL